MSKPVSFDTDSHNVTVNNGVRYTVTNDLKDLKVMPHEIGSNGNSSASYVGTVK